MPTEAHRGDPLSQKARFLTIWVYKIATPRVFGYGLAGGGRKSREILYSRRGYGAEHPVAPNTHSDGSDDPEGRQMNRRVEITIRK